MYGHQLMNINTSELPLITPKTYDKTLIKRISECGVILFSNRLERILLVLQEASKKWGFPKGHMTRWELYNKQYFDCAKRELYEETGIDLNRTRHSKMGTLIIGKKLFYVIEIYSNNNYLKTMDKKEILSLKWINRTNLFNFVSQNNCNITLTDLFERI